MFLKVANFLLISAGFLLIVRATVRYHKLLGMSRRAAYTPPRMNALLERLFRSMFYLFIFGFIVGLVDTSIRDVDPIYTFIVMIFFFGALFICIDMEMQISLLQRVTEKNLEILKTFVNAVEMKDSYTKGHSIHVVKIMSLFYDHFDDRLKARVEKSKLLDAALLHDCGKISIKDEILNKPGALTPEDMDAIRRHPANGKKMLDDTAFHEISDWVLYHHERMDGNGYYGLPGDRIPLEARAIAIVDTYSALRTDRPYRPRSSHEEAAAIMRGVSGTQLDSALLDQFLRIDRDALENL